jgi:hypothetical protein
MALDKQTKSVLFSEGMGDGTDRFLLEAPAIDYAENLRVDKQGSLQKRPGFGPDALGTVPNATGEPVAMMATGNSLHVVTENGARSWNGTSWEETDASGFVGTSRVEVESQNFIGLGGCAYQTFKDVSDNIVGHAIAYEVRGENSVTDSTADSAKHVIFQRYDADGRFVDQKRFDDARSPQFTDKEPQQAALFYQDISSKELMLFHVFSPTLAPIISGTPFGIGITPSTRPRMPQYADLADGPRLGQGVYGQARYLVGHSASEERFYILYTRDDGLGVNLRETYDTTGGITDSAEVYIRVNAQADILALEVGVDGVVVVYQWWDRGTWAAPGTGNYAVVAQKYDLDDLSTMLEHNIISDNSANNMPMYTHGTVGSYHESGGLQPWVSMVALHMSGYGSGSIDEWSLVNPSQGLANEWQPWNTRSEEAGIKTFVVTWGVGAAWYGADLSGHRITTNPVRHNDKWYMGVQQWIDYTPQHLDPYGCEKYLYILPAAKPVTTAICVFDLDEPMRPVATLDAGASGHVDYAESEVAIHLGTLEIDGSDLLVSNRVKLSAEDNSLYLGHRDGSESVPQGAWTRSSNVEVSSDSLCRVHRIQSGGAGAYAANFGDGIVLSTAVPMWYDGRFFSEFGPIDSPEIMRVEDADFATWEPPGTNSAYMNNTPTQGYDEMRNTQDVVYRKFAAIYGFVDTHGNTHRSAPSQTLYVADVEEGKEIDGNGKYPGRQVTVMVARPLSVLREDLEYFVEIYVSTDVDSDMQLAMQSSVKLGQTNQPILVTFQLNRASISTDDTTQPLLRSSEPLYTSGGVLAADPWPAFAYSVAQSTRFWAIDSTNRGRVIYSKLFEDFIAPEYNPTLSINLGDERSLTAIGKLDDKVVVFEPNDIHVIYGEGPDNRGQGQDFAVNYIATDVGCEDQESVVETPIGLIFYNKPRGFYLLDRNLQIQFIGEGIEDTARDIDILSAVLVKDKAEVRFAYTGGPGPQDRLGPDADTAAIERPPRPVFTNVGWSGEKALTFNYERKTWMTYTNYDAQAATIYQNKYTMLRSDWTVWQEKDDRWDDPTGLNLTTLTTPWIKLSENIQGFNRLWRMTVLGRYLSSLQDLGTDEFEGGDIRVRVYFDYEATYQQEKIFKLQDFVRNPFNATPLRADRLQFEITPQRGRCQAVKLEISEQATEAVAEGIAYKQGRGFEISAVDFHVGVSPMQSLLPNAVRK